MSSPDLRLAAVGDLQLGDSPSCVGFGFRSRPPESGLEGALAGVRSALAGADVVFGNLETPLSDRGLVAGDWARFQLRGAPASAKVLREVGFTVLNIANNHAVQHGLGVFEDTQAILREAGIACCGVRGVPPWASQPVELSPRGGTRLGVLGYCLRPRQYGGEEPPYAEGSAEAIVADVRRLRPLVDAVIVSLHWGEEFVDLPSTSEVRLGHSIIEAGALVVVGHHPHVVRPVERYQHGIIAYSLGNLVGDMVWHPPFRRGAILRCVMDAGGLSSVEVESTRLASDFRTELGGPGAPISDGPLGIPEEEYAAEVQRTVREQRLSSYRYAISNLGRYPPRMLAQLAGRTLRNKLGGLLGGQE